MSAYDNPTIIKDDTAMAWAQATGAFSENFKQSFDIARREREAKEKEARLEAEKKAKEDKIDSLNKQIFNSEQAYNAQARAAKINDGLVKAGVSADGTALVNEYSVSTSKVEAEANFNTAFEILSKEQQDKNNLYAAQRAKGEENLTRVAGAMYSQAQAIKNGDINGTNIANIKFKGNNILDQTLNRITTYALAYPDSDKTTKTLDYDANGDPSDITLQVNTKIGNRNDLVKTFRDTNPGVSQEEIELKIAEGISKGFITQEGEGGNEQYAINFKKKINPDYDGELYTTIPEIKYGDAPVTAGIYSKENDTEVSAIYMLPTEFADVAGNAKLGKEQGTDKYQRTPVDIKAMKIAIKPALIAKAEGMIAAYFSDPDTTDGILQKLGFGTNYQSKEFATKSLEEKVNLLVGKMEENEIKNIIAKSQLKEINGQYYKMDAENVKIFDNASSRSGSGSSGGKTKTELKKEADLQRVVKQVWDMQSTSTADLDYDGRKVSHSGGEFIIQTAGINKDMPIGRKEDVIEYLRTGAYNPK
jgi:hypothetical protein